MRIRELKLSCWRNFHEADVTFAPGLNFVTGPNGAGKTNLLEAVAYLGQTRSFRRALDRNLITEGEKLASIQGVFEVEGEVYSRTVDIRISTQAKSISVDGKRFKTTSSYFGNVSTISFDPRRVFLFKGEPSERRRAMDEACAAIDGRYLHALSRYKRLLKERNRALAQGLDDDVLAAYSGQLITCAYQLIRQRCALVSSASAKAATLFAALFDPEARFSLTYLSKMPQTDDLEAFRAEAQGLFEQRRSLERIRRATSIGPHLDDLECRIDDHPVQIYGSQGQNRLASLAFILALAQIIRERRGDPPILVLDDVLSDLDSTRRSALIEVVSHLGQTIVSGSTTDVPADANIIAIEHGEIRHN